MNEEILKELYQNNDIRETKKLIKSLNPEELTLGQIVQLENRLNNVQYTKKKTINYAIVFQLMVMLPMYFLVGLAFPILLESLSVPPITLILLNEIITLTFPKVCLEAVRNHLEIVKKKISSNNHTLTKLKKYVLTLKHQKINNLPMEKQKSNIFQRIKNRLLSHKYNQLLKKYTPKQSLNIKTDKKVENANLLNTIKHENNILLVIKNLSKLNLNQLSLNELEDLNHTLNDKNLYVEKNQVNNSFYKAVRNSFYMAIIFNTITSLYFKPITFIATIPALLTVPLGNFINAEIEKIKKNSEYVDIKTEIISSSDMIKLNYYKSIIQKEIEFRKENLETPNYKKENPQRENVIDEKDLEISNHITEISNMIQTLPKEVENKYKLMLRQIVAKYEKEAKNIEKKDYFQNDYSQMNKNELEKRLLELKEKIEKECSISSKGEKGNLIMSKLNEIIDLKDQDVICQAFSKLTRQIPDLIKDEDIIFINTIINLVSEYYLMILKKYPFINITRLINEIDPIFYQAIESALERELINQSLEATILQQKETFLKKDNDNRHYIEKLSNIYTQSFIKNSGKITATR